jgi:5-methylcytosine-specific restriction endonuclease McrA
MEKILITETRKKTTTKTRKRTDEEIPKVKASKKKNIPKAVRMKVWESTIGNVLSGKCYTCNRDLKVDSFETGHIISEKNGGKIEIENLKVVCKPCNTSCGTMNLDDFKRLMNTKEDVKEVTKQVILSSEVVPSTLPIQRIRTGDWRDQLPEVYLKF